MSPHHPPRTAAWLDALPDGGEMGARLRGHDWTTTPLGPVEAWPEALRTAVGTVISSRFPMMIAWGTSFTQIYNDAFVQIYGEKHPQLAVPIGDTWSEIWDVIQPMLLGVMATREATWAEDQLLWVDRVGFPEDAYFTFSFSPLMDEAGRGLGILTTAVETTPRVVDARRFRAIGDVGAQQTPGLLPTAELVIEAIGRHPDDLPFGVLYLRDPTGAHVLAGSTGIEPGSAGAPGRVEAGGGPWPLDHDGPAPLVEDDVQDRVGLVLHELSGSPVRSAAVLRVGTFGTLVVGLSPSRRIDDGHHAFLGLLVRQLEAGLTVAHAIETEQARVDDLLALDRAKSAFFSNVSHELRTPVTLMLAPLADVLADVDAPLSGPQAARVGAAHRNAQRLVGLVDDVLDFSRDEGDAPPPRLEPVRLGSRTTELADAFALAAEHAGLELRIDCPEPAGAAWIDPRTWERVVLNLVGNALKFTTTGWIAVRLTDAGDHVVLEVEDSGTGIPTGELERIFDRFHRVPNPKARTSEGVGIGLSLVRRLLEAVGGTIGVRSTVGAGTCFRVELPLGRHPDEVAVTGPQGDATAGAHPVAIAVPAAPEPGSSGRAGRAGAAALALAPEAATDTGGTVTTDPDAPVVLFVDDNADMRAYVRGVLEPAFRVVTRADGTSALQLAVREPPDLVLTDVMMPGLDGFGLLRALREDPATAGVPVVMLSARAGGEAIVDGLNAGADEYLLKPFSSFELVARVRSTIELTRAREQVARAAAQHEADRRFLRAEARFRHAGRAASVGTWSLDIVTGETEVDESFERMFGVAPGELNLLADCLAYVVPEDRDRVVLEVAAAAAGRDDTIHQFGIVRPDGERREFQWRASVALDDEPRSLLFGATWDATELADAQAAIRESEQAAPSGIAIVERDGRIARVNRALGALVGRSPEVLTGTTFEQLVHPADRVITPGPAEDGDREVRLVHADGSGIWATVSSATVAGADGGARHQVVHVQDARQRKQFERELRHLADHDSLTGLLNRRRFGEEAESALADPSTTGRRGALVLFDVDGLKRINDTLGHATGDELLVAVADALRASLRPTDVAARLGGDEFAVLLSAADERGARAFAARVLERIRHVGPVSSDAWSGGTSACSGIALFGDDEDHRSGEELLIDADVALYDAKDAGAGQIRVHVSALPLGPDDPSRPRWSGRVRSALEDAGFVLHAQPIVALQEPAEDSWELLLRMRGSGDDLIAPASFLPSAERSGLIGEVDRWVVRTAIRELAALRESGRDVRFSVNLSARSIVDPAMADFVVGEIREHEVDGRALVFEVTETAAMMNVEQARRFARAVQSEGCALALDDFGAGFTSFHYLRHLNFDHVKIDGAFIRGLPSDPLNQGLVRALSAMARGLGKRTVAEFVDDDETVSWLRAAGIDYAQGYLLGRPRPLATLQGPEVAPVPA